MKNACQSSHFLTAKKKKKKTCPGRFENPLCPEYFIFFGRFQLNGFIVANFLNSRKLIDNFLFSFDVYFYFSI